MLITIGFSRLKAARLCGFLRGVHGRMVTMDADTLGGGACHSRRQRQKQETPTRQDPPDLGQSEQRLNQAESALGDENLTFLEEQRELFERQNEARGPWIINSYFSQRLRVKVVLLDIDNVPGRRSAAAGQAWRHRLTAWRRISASPAIHVKPSFGYPTDPHATRASF